MKRQIVTQTKSGLFVRDDSTMGLLVFSPYTGNIFACNSADKTDVIRWLNKQTKTISSATYEKALGPEWAISIKESEYPANHLLPNPESYDNPCPSYPIVINWLLTGACALQCKYCYAEDLMRGKCKEPSKEDVLKIAQAVLSFSPLAVVLTGGDPLLSPHLETVMAVLYGKTGLIIDTSGFTFNETHLNIFKKYGVFVRVSLDSEIPQVNDLYRVPLQGEKQRANMSSGYAAFNTLCQCLDAGLGVGIQSVAADKSRQHLAAFGDKLFKMRVRSWRILMVAKSASNAEHYKKIVNEEGLERFEDTIKSNLRKKHTNGWNKGMSVQMTHNRAPNSVILVSPEGIFLTEKKHGNGKVVIDARNHKKPRLSEIFSQQIAAHEHAERYLNGET